MSGIREIFSNNFTVQQVGEISKHFFTPQRSIFHSLSLEGLSGYRIQVS